MDAERPQLRGFPDTGRELKTSKRQDDESRDIYNKVITKSLTQITVRESDKLFDEKIMSRMAR